MSNWCITINMLKILRLFKCALSQKVKPAFIHIFFTRWHKWHVIFLPVKDDVICKAKHFRISSAAAHRRSRYPHEKSPSITVALQQRNRVEMFFWLSQEPWSRQTVETACVQVQLHSVLVHWSNNESEIVLTFCSTSSWWPWNSWQCHWPAVPFIQYSKRQNKIKASDTNISCTKHGWHWCCWHKLNVLSVGHDT